MRCEPACQIGVTETVSVKLPFVSAVIMLLLLLSVIGIVASRVKPIRPFGVKCEPCRVIVVPRTTVVGVTCSVNCVFCACDCERIPRPNVATMPKSPPSTSATMSSMLIQKNSAGGIERVFLYGGMGVRRCLGNVSMPGRGVTGGRGVVVGRKGCALRTLCQLLPC